MADLCRGDASISIQQPLQGRPTGHGGRFKRIAGGKQEEAGLVCKPYRTWRSTSIKTNGEYTGPMWSSAPTG